MSDEPADSGGGVNIDWGRLSGSTSGGGSRKGPWGLIEWASGKELAAIAIAVVGSWIGAFGQGVNAMINAGFSLFVDPVLALVGGSVGVISDTYAGWRAILRQGAETTVTALAPGSAWVIDPIAQAMAIASIGFSLWAIAKILQQPFTSGSVFGTIVDNPIISLVSETPEEEADQN